jgi:hypothetical protein
LSAGQHSKIVTESSHCFRNGKETQDAVFAQNLSCQINLPNTHASTKDCCMRKEDLRRKWRKIIVGESPEESSRKMLNELDNAANSKYDEFLMKL